MFDKDHEDSPDEKLIEKAARAIQREYLHTNDLPDATEQQFQQDFERHGDQYRRMAQACAKILIAEDLRYWASHNAIGKTH